MNDQALEMRIVCEGHDERADVVRVVALDSKSRSISQICQKDYLSQCAETDTTISTYRGQVVAVPQAA